MSKNNTPCAFEFKPETVLLLRDMKESFESSYGRRMTDDEFAGHLMAAVEEGDVAVWEIFCRKQYDEKELDDMVGEIRKF